MKKTYKFTSRLIVGIALIAFAIWLIWTVLSTIVFPRLPLKDNVDYVQDVPNSMSQPDKTYARNAISEASKYNKIAIVLDYQLTTFDVDQTYIDKIVGNIVNNVYKNQTYIVYTYFKDTKKLLITTNIDDSSKDVVDKIKDDINNDARVVKEILYYQQNLEKEMGLRNWNFDINSEYMKNTVFAGIGSIILLILGIGVLPTSEEGLRFPFKKEKKAKRKSDAE